MKKILTQLFGLVLLLTLGMPLYAEGNAKVAFVNTAKVLEQAPQAKAARERLETEFAPRDEQLLASQKQVKSQEERLLRDGAVMSEEERQKMERDILSLKRELKRSRDAFNEDLNLRRNDEFAKLQRQVAEAIVTIAKKNNFDLIFESGVVYASQKVDITDLVLEYLRGRVEPTDNTGSK